MRSKPVPGTLGCSDHDCIFGHPGGMGTNGGCACLKEIRSIDVRRRFMANIRVYRGLIARIDPDLLDKLVSIS